MAEICQRYLEGFGMPADWTLDIVVPIMKGMGDIRTCSCYGVLKLLEHVMKVVEGVFEKRLPIIMSFDMLFCLREEQLMLCLS